MTLVSQNNKSSNDLEKLKKKVSGAKGACDRAANASFYVSVYVSFGLTAISILTLFAQDIFSGERGAFTGLMVGFAGILSIFLSFSVRENDYERKSRDLYWCERDIAALESKIKTGQSAASAADVEEIKQRYYDSAPVVEARWRIFGMSIFLWLFVTYMATATVVIFYVVMAEKGLLPKVHLLQMVRATLGG